MTNRVPLNMERLLRAESVQTERPHWMDGRDWSVNPPLAGMIQEVLWQMRPERCVESGTFLALGTAIIAKRLRDLEVRGATLDTVDFGKNDDDLTATDDDWRRLGQLLAGPAACNRLGAYAPATGPAIDDLLREMYTV